MKIEVLGDGCSRCDKFYENVVQAVKESGKEAEIESFSHRQLLSQNLMD